MQMHLELLLFSSSSFMYVVLTFICELIDYKYSHQHDTTTHGNASHDDSNPPIGVFLTLIIIFEEQPQQRVR
jgi:hypothetical protein